MNTRTTLAAVAAALLLPAPSALSAPADDPSSLMACGTYPEDRTTSRQEALDRAQTWLDDQVTYSQQSCHENSYGRYRTDCSGYVSMAWGLDHSRATTDLAEVSREIPREELMPGDALNSPGHVALFVRWEDGARTRPVVREHTGPDGAPVVERSWSPETAAGYTPIRYLKIAG
ncbi:NlpC/P60 family protein [Saccharothrix syringae]|uniref:NlpC/P60 domain-containing protein n=1 Tax=Saccharothrix syringae TaxID=103733 RepID=A0A5Q0H601_SACSY|nr:hypothetical protein [Saccharothrix syringae]QFZ21636.1 hypothetical protein EKG83_33375 [Saccharothrix syringae]